MVGLGIPQDTQKGPPRSSSLRLRQEWRPRVTDFLILQKKKKKKRPRIMIWM